MKPIAVLCVLFGSVLAGSLSAQPTEVQLNRAGLDPARLTVLGEPGYDYRLESAPNLGAPEGWEFLATFSLNGTPESWLDARSLSQPQRFYRSIKLPVQDPEIAQDFRLIDQTGRSRWLFYYFGLPSVRAVALLFTGTGCGKLAEMTPTIKALTNRFGSQGVVFWLIDSNTGDNRSNILAEATALGMSNGPPILHDSAQVVARSYGASGIPEAVLINMANFQVAYRGAIDDRLGSNAAPTTQQYLSNALVRVLAGDTVNPKQTRLEGCSLNLKPTYPNLAYATDIAPILQDKCVRCHSPGNIGSFVMSNYNVIQSIIGTIRHEVITGHMPPWHADPFYSQFSNDASLSPDQLAKLIQWIDDGAPRGLGSDPLANPLPTTNYPAAWPASLGQPDAILRIPVQSVPASGTIAYRYITVVNDAFGSDVWLRAAVCRPGDARVVHHCLVFEGDSSSSLGGLAGFYAGYVPGQDPAPFPSGTGKLLKRGQSLTFQMHYTAIGEASTDQTELGLYLAAAPPTYPLQTKAAYSITFNVPANAADYQATAQFPGAGTLNTNIVIYEMSPHMHLRGSRFRYEVVYPTGARETLLNVPNYIFHWQSLYRFAQPKYLPRGSRIICTAGWDNSTQNHELHAAYDGSDNALYLPDRNVGFGEQSWDEMFIGYMNYAEVPGPQ
jgi:hypothetical protein